MKYPNLLVTVHPLKGSTEKWGCNVVEVSNGVLRLSRVVEDCYGEYQREHVASFPLTGVYRWHEARL